MKNFEFCNPTKIIFGEGALEQVGEETKATGQKVLFVYGKSHIKKTGLFDKVITSLKGADVEYVEFPGVKSNPLLSHTRDGIALAKKEKVDGILAVGGGSVLDESKAIAAGAMTEDDVWDFFTGEKQIQKALPLGTVLTIPATGSEMNGGMVVTNEETKEKFGFMSEHTYPKFSILDPTLTYTIPANYAAYSAVDSISHLIEGYLTHKDKWSPIHDRYVEGLVKTIMESTEKILADPKDYQGRATMMWAATLAWNGLGTAGIGECQIPNHMLEHPISGIYDIAHGAGLSIVIPAWTWWVSKSQPKRIAQMGREVFNVNETDDIKAAQECSKGFKAWFDKIGSPTSFSGAGIEEPDFEALADQAITLGKIWGITNYTKEELIEIYKLCV
jgi:alcohol dehydrogenase YqhD (iron-dependent ADH family)